MVRSTGFARAVALAAVWVIVGAACSSAGTGSGLTGKVNGDGSSTVFPVTEAVAEEYRAVEPNVQVTVGVSGTGGGFKKFCNGETDFSDASRPIKDTEIELCKKDDVSYEEFQVAVDGLAVTVHPENDWAECLTADELGTIWAPDSEKKITSWKQVRDGFPDVPLKLFGPGTDSGTFDYFTDVINGEEGASRTDYTASENDNDLVTGVSGNRGAIGYFGFAYYTENADKLTVVSVDGGNGCVTPSDETVKANTYSPLSRPLYVYIATDSVERPEVKSFFDFFFAEVQGLVGDVGYTPMSEDVYNQQLAKWQALAA